MTAHPFVPPLRVEGAPAAERRTRPSVLDILTAVKTVAQQAPAIRAWWLASAAHLRVEGGEGNGRRVELVVETAPGGGAAPLEAVGARLGLLLGGAPVTVRVAGSAEGTRGLVRLLSRSGS